jgi:hypothetical protein
VPASLRPQLYNLRLLSAWCASRLRGEQCTDLVVLMIDGIHFGGQVLVVADGSKALYAGVERVFGQQVEVQRCQIHMRRNVIGECAMPTR